MKTAKLIALLMVLALLGFGLFLAFLTVDVPVGKVGVCTRGTGLLRNQTVVAKDFGPGWHRDLGRLDAWELYDSTIQTLALVRNPDPASDGGDAVEIASADGCRVWVDVTVTYRIKPGEAHLLHQEMGLGTYRDVVRSQVWHACEAKLAGMTVGQFLDPAESRSRTQAIRELLDPSLSAGHLQVVDVILRDVAFDAVGEGKLRAKRLADQEGEASKSVAEAEAMAGKAQLIEAETASLVRRVEEEQKAEIVRCQADTDLKIASMKAEAERYASERRADADLVQAQKEAEGDRLMKLAEAEGEKLRSQALAVEGGSIVAALEAARNIAVGQVTVSTTQTDLLDLNGMAETLGVPSQPAK